MVNKMSNPLDGFTASNNPKMPLSQKAWALAFVLFVGAIGGLIGQHWLAKSKPWEPGIVEVANTRKAIEKAAAELMVADRKGDRRGATDLFDTATFLLRNIEAAPYQSGAMQNCKLAAAHLADGVLSVSQGGSWGAKSRYENALADCR